jgi:prepilin-type N-terminal cleavage/methylation domain-containing protein
MEPERGYSLLELLIAATILAVALLGIGLLASRALYDAASLRDHALAAILLRDLQARADLVGHARMEPDAAGGGIAGSELSTWRGQAETLLPSVASALCRNGAPPASADFPPASCDGSGPLRGRLVWRREAVTGTEWREAVIRP